MKHRRVFSTLDLSTAKTAIVTARSVGIDDAAIALVAKDDVEIHSISSGRLDPRTDTTPAAMRGIVCGALVGTIAGGIAHFVPSLRITLGETVFVVLIGAMIGAWSSALMGSTIPNEVRRHFKDEIDQGRVLVVIDARKRLLARAESALAEIGARRLPFDRLSFTL